MEFTIREEASREDQIHIESVIVSAFLNADHRSGTEARIVEKLRASSSLSISLVAEVRTTIVGHVAVSPVTVSDGSPGWFGLGPLSVLPAYQGLGIGTGLMEAALQRLRDSGAAGCVLLGDPAYYQRFGFSSHSDLVLPDVPAEYFQALPLGVHIPQGIVHYNRAFDA